MKWKTKTDQQKRDEINMAPHRWFAWFPVHVGYNEYRWLEYVYRQRHFYDEYVGTNFYYTYFIVLDMQERELGENK